MGRRKKEENQEQLDLIDVSPENIKEILRAAKGYNMARVVHRKALSKKTEEKERIVMLVKDAKLQPGPDGIIKFRHSGVRIWVTPRDDAVKVKCDDEDSEE